MPLQYLVKLDFEFANRVDEALSKADFLPQSAKTVISNLVNAKVPLSGGGALAMGKK